MSVGHVLSPQGSQAVPTSLTPGTTPSFPNDTTQWYIICLKIHPWRDDLYWAGDKAGHHIQLCAGFSLLGHSSCQRVHADGWGWGQARKFFGQYVKAIGCISDFWWRWLRAEIEALQRAVQVLQEGKKVQVHIGQLDCKEDNGYLAKRAVGMSTWLNLP